VPSNAPVLGDGGITASPFLYGQSISDYNETIGTNPVPLSCRSPADPGFGSCHQCFNAHFHRLIGEHGLVHRLANSLRIRSPGTSPKNLQKGDEARSSSLGVTFLLAFQFPRLHEFGTTGWYDSHCLPHIRPLTPSNSLQLSCQRVSNIWRNYME